MKKISILLIVLVFVVSFCGCSKTKKSVVVASKPMTEQYIIGHMITELIESKTDIKVEQKFGIGGGTSNIHPAMISGDIDIYPEYTGTGWLFVLKEELISDPMQIYKKVMQGYKKEFNIKWLGLYGFNNTFGIAVKEELATKYKLKSYSDLAKISNELVFAAEYDFYEREDGYDNICKEYGFDFKDTKEIDIGLKYQAIGEGKVDVINVFSTDGRLKEKKLVVLEDDKNYFPPYAATTLVREETLKKYPELEEVLELLTNNISNEEIIYLNYLVEIDKQDPKKVAHEFLIRKELLK